MPYKTVKKNSENLKAPAIKSMKRAFSRSKLATAVKEKHIVPDQKGLRGGKVIRCQLCGNLCPSYKAQVDHIDPVCPVMLSLNSMSFDMIYERLFCAESNLQVICPDCHLSKSNLEKTDRVYWRKEKKYLVCRIKGGSRIKVFPIIDLKGHELDGWDILSVFDNRKDADHDSKKRRKI